MLLPNFAEIKIPFQDRAETIGILGENDEFLRVLNDSFACRIIGRGTDLPPGHCRPFSPEPERVLPSTPGTGPGRRRTYP